MLYFLLCLILGFGLIALRQLHNGLGAPSTIWLLSIFLCCVGAFVGQLLWDNFPLSADAFLVMMVAAATFVFVSVLIAGTLGGGTEEVSSLNQCENPLPLWVFGVTVLLALLTFFAYNHDVRIILQNYGSSSSDLMQLIADYREFTVQSAQGQIEGDYGKISFVSSVLYRALEVVVVFVTYNFVFLSPLNRKRRWPLYALTVAVVCAVMFLTSGSRAPIVHFVISVGVLIALKYDRAGKVIGLGTILRGGAIAVIILLVFSAASVIRGEKMELGLVGYLSFFFGSGLTSFNHLADDQLLTQVPSAFSALTDMLSKLVEVPTDDGAGSLWISYQGYSSNVFTGFSRFYADCGVLGVFAYSGVIAVVFSVLYGKATTTDSRGFVVAYSFFGYVIFDVIRTDTIGALLGMPLIEYTIIIVATAAIYRSAACRCGSRDAVKLERGGYLGRSSCDE